jgi:hypothetical protein
MVIIPEFPLYPQIGIPPVFSNCDRDDLLCGLA